MSLPCEVNVLLSSGGASTFIIIGGLTSTVSEINHRDHFQMPNKSLKPVMYNLSNS